ncbi:hypothetical protein HMPREF0973_01887 [Prevotella veroralis F0319]|uniref:Uncharacterized protein n=1 Tax=Prevotella veroralis F0319 TaxID=649761 RepID=C9MQI7_9BACT|nr:hypothetical protein HMPREF0973_01887 [Prevotella veroralis F0319]
MEDMKANANTQRIILKIFLTINLRFNVCKVTKSSLIERMKEEKKILPLECFILFAEGLLAFIKKLRSFFTKA